jgi:ABC-type sugar transport system substrate-binding protein
VGPAAALLAVALAALVLAGCGGGGSSTTSSTPSTSTGGEENATTETGSEGADVAAAEAALKPYVGQYSPAFPVDEPLKEKPTPDTTVTTFQEPSAIGGLLAESIVKAGETAGVKVEQVKFGTTASAAQSAAETVVQQEPEAVIVPPANLSVITNQLDELNQNGTSLVGEAIFGAEEHGFKANIAPPEQIEIIGRLLADWSVAKNGSDTNVVLFMPPELEFVPTMEEAFLGEVKKLCADCTAAVEPIKIEEASQAANRIVSKLQSDPGINQVVALSEFINGLPAAMKAADLEVGVLSYQGEPQVLEYVKNGEIEAALANGFVSSAWVMMDAALRLVQGQELTKGEKSGIVPMQILTQKDITFDPSKGWEPVPDFAEQLAKYWHAGE